MLPCEEGCRAKKKSKPDEGKQLCCRVMKKSCRVMFALLQKWLQKTVVANSATNLATAICYGGCYGILCDFGYEVFATEYFATKLLLQNVTTVLLWNVAMVLLWLLLATLWLCKVATEFSYKY
ncbi:hypothetical protein QVD17_24563 [Tagetes erecta]|uniref:Uncharacterized protein n=1 Tax=Tagetes erecta TaxID=13708 RepID=A0AAD8KKA8_TARER|nr:hypothetical protein QVD17_24563 [Tagetes erecta]